MYFEREEGYWTGAMAINLIVTELAFTAVMVGVIVATWPNIPTIPLLIAGLAVNAVVSIAFYPLAKTIWIAIDLILHPLEPSEMHESETLQRIREHSLSED